jgi:hypothetical protein
MILNHRPVTKEELAGLLEELDDRMNDKKQDQLLKIVSKEFGNVRAADLNDKGEGDAEDDER